MLESIKRWFSGAPPQAGWEEAQQWAESRRHQFKRTRDSHGFVIDSGTSPPWRLEWGPSQRDYIDGQELRVRGELGAGTSLQMLIVSRALMESLEKQVFEQYVEGTQTRIDTETPEEMRWLVLYPKLAATELKSVREHVGGVSNDPQWLPQWLEGALAQKIVEAHGAWLGPDDALVLIVQRGRLTMRTRLDPLDTTRMACALGLFEVALHEARRVAAAARSGTDSTASETPSATPSLWDGDTPV